MKIVKMIGVMALLFILGGCATSALMPSERTESIGSTKDLTTYTGVFNLYQFMVKHMESEPLTLAELRDHGLDTSNTANITVVGVSDIFSMYWKDGVQLENLPPWLQRCFKAMTSCRGYLYDYTFKNSNGVGSMTKRFMQFKKEDMLTDRSAKLIFVAIGMQQHEDEVIFVQYPGGTPLGSTQLRIVRKPLGPLQSFFENPGDKLVVPLLHF